MAVQHHHDPPAYSSSQLLETAQSLRQDKETLKSALRTALATRDELRDCLEDTEERCRALERSNALLRRESESALRKAENARQELIRLREQDQMTIYQLAERTKALEELSKRPSSRQSRPADPGISEGIEQYAQSVLGKLRFQAKLTALFRERAHSEDRFWARVQARHYDICLFRLLQFLSDLLTALPEARPATGSNHRSVSCQTLVETGTNTDYVERETKERWSEGPAVVLNSTTSSSHEETANCQTIRGKEDYERLMGESEQLLNSLYIQSNRLARLNAHVQETMRATSPRSMQSTALSPIAPVPLSPQPQDTIEDWPEQQEIPTIQPSPDLPASPKDMPRSVRKLKPRPKKPYQPLPNKIDVTAT